MPSNKAKSIWMEVNNDKLNATTKMFNVAYMCAMEDLPFTMHPKVIELMEKNSIPKCSMLFSEKACASIIEHVCCSRNEEQVDFIS